MFDTLLELWLAYWGIMVLILVLAGIAIVITMIVRSGGNFSNRRAGKKWNKVLFDIEGEDEDKNGT